MNKALLVITGMMFITSLMATIAGQMLPESVRAEETLISYSHRGEFSCTAFAATGETGDAPVALLYPKIIEHIDILVSYAAPETETLSIRMFLEDQYGGWRKEIPIQVSRGPLYTLTLDIDEVLALGNKINTELGGRSSIFILDIIASGGPSASPITAILRGLLTPSTLTWNEDGFYEIEKGFPGDGKLRTIAFGYRVQLRENSLFGPVLMEALPHTPRLVALKTGTEYTGPVEYVDIDFHYQLLTSNQISSLTREVQFELKVTDEEGLTKTFEILPWTLMEGDAGITMTLDIGGLTEVTRHSTAVDTTIPQDRQITLTAKVHVIAETKEAKIDETFSQSLNGNIGRLMTWNLDSENGNKLVSLKPGVISTMTEKRIQFIGRLRTISLIVLAASAVAFCGIMAIQWRRGTGFFASRKESARPKKYKELISEVGAFPPVAMGYVITGVPSLDALAKISNNTLKPILLKIEADKYSYRVIDGQLTFEYVKWVGRG